ncbi:EamA family transporter [Geomesophilobacter sediminis]|uniref:EamA family transporter n=1 Tax=Geomesophilobacter sediminis TaxID=2798584 RepID=A0A8J7INL4_9BACT|nr:EamA family transporter [Geomesophilobacter sediminis]MBJ6724848.1 EamA family transporter [Geomesophilobacter sediminis]
MLWFWVPLTLFSAFMLATSDALLKKALSGRNEYLVTWARTLPALPFLLALLLFVDVPPLAPEFLPSTLWALPLETVALFLYTKALKLSPLSLTLPLLSLTPVFLLVVPSLILGETISPTGAAGVLLVAAGSYLLHLPQARQGWLTPIRALLSDRGSLCMLAVAVIYSVTSVLGKRAIAASSPLFFAAVYLPLLAVIVTPVALWKGRREIREMGRNGTVRATVLPSLCYLVQALSHVYAINVANVAYMIAVKRTSLLFGVLYGRLLFHEEGTTGRMLATILMLIGVLLIVWEG